MKIYKEKPGVISVNTVWCCIDNDGYLYIHDTLLKLLWQIISEWKHDKHLVG